MKYLTCIILFMTNVFQTDLSTIIFLIFNDPFKLKTSSRISYCDPKYVCIISKINFSVGTYLLKHLNYATSYRHTLFGKYQQPCIIIITHYHI